MLFFLHFLLYLASGSVGRGSQYLFPRKNVFFLRPKAGHLCRIFGYVWIAAPRVAVLAGGGKISVLRGKNVYFWSFRA